MEIKDITTALNALKQFETAANNVGTADKKSAIVLSGTGDSVNVSTTDKPGLFGKLFRSQSDMNVNNDTRKTFMTALKFLLNAKSESDVAKKIGEDLKLKDFGGKGRPLSAFRIKTILNKALSVGKTGGVNKGGNCSVPKDYANKCATFIANNRIDYFNVMNAGSAFNKILNDLSRLLMNSNESIVKHSGLKGIEAEVLKQDLNKYLSNGIKILFEVNKGDKKIKDQKGIAEYAKKLANELEQFKPLSNFAIETFKNIAAMAEKKIDYKVPKTITADNMYEGFDMKESVMKNEGLMIITSYTLDGELEKMINAGFDYDFDKSEFMTPIS